MRDGDAILVDGLPNEPTLMLTNFALPIVRAVLAQAAVFGALRWVFSGGRLGLDGLMHTDEEPTNCP